MQAIIERCCGLDVHQGTVVACLLIGAPGAQPTKEVRTFRTVTRDLEALRDWLRAVGVTHVGMESMGVYWRPVYAVLEGHFELIVGNARHIRNVPGRKTDVKDSEWIADLVRQIAKSFVPPRPLRELRELLRYRRKLVESQAAEQPAPEAAGDRQHQAGERRQRCLRRIRPRDAPGADRGRGLESRAGGRRRPCPAPPCWRSPRARRRRKRRGRRRSRMRSERSVGCRCPTDRQRARDCLCRRRRGRMSSG